MSIEAPNRNSQLDIYIKSLSTGYQSQLIIKFSIQDLIYQNNVYLIYFLCFEKNIYIYVYIYIYREREREKSIELSDYIPLLFFQCSMFIYRRIDSWHMQY